MLYPEDSAKLIVLAIERYKVPTKNVNVALFRL